MVAVSRVARYNMAPYDDERRRRWSMT